MATPGKAQSVSERDEQRGVDGVRKWLDHLGRVVEARFRSGRLEKTSEPVDALGHNNLSARDAPDCHPRYLFCDGERLRAKVITFNTGAAGTTVNVAHGLDPSKVRGWIASLQYSASPIGMILPNHPIDAGYVYNTVLLGDKVYASVASSPSGSNAADKPVTVTIFYVE